MVRKKYCHYLLGNLLAVVLLFGCHSNQDEQATKDSTQVITVHKQPNIAHLYYNGVIKPIKDELIISPANGIVTKVNFQYGDMITKGQQLLTLNSIDLENEFREIFTSYLKAKQAYLNSMNNMRGVEELRKSQIISDQEYFNEKSQYQNGLLAYLDAQHKLEQIAKDVPEISHKLNKLTLNDTQLIQALLRERFNNAVIHAQSSGIVLFPENSNADNDNKQIHLGYEVKKGDVLLAIGDLSGIAINTEVNEIDVNRLYRGQKVKITLSSQPEELLHGEIISVARQAKSNGNGELAMFPIVIHVPELTPQQAQNIRIGMSAKADIIISEPVQIKIPINAVFNKSGQHWVTIIDPNTGRKKEVVVTTGATTLHEVTILSGLKSGDKVINHD
jgi:HlyD family secretion protein